jgi:hypothetical protein
MSPLHTVPVIDCGIVPWTVVLAGGRDTGGPALDHVLVRAREARVKHL